MITPKLTAALVVMTALAGLAPAAVFAQDAVPLALVTDPRDGDDGTSVEDIVSNAISTSQSAVQAADTSADDNNQINNAEVTQTQVASAACVEDCEDVSASQEDLEQESDVDQDNSIETGDVDQEQDVEQDQELEDIVQFALDELTL
jgi:hypothetical protein